MSIELLLVPAAIVGGALVTIGITLINFASRFGSVERAVLEHSKNDEEVLRRLGSIEKVLMEGKR